MKHFAALVLTVWALQCATTGQNKSLVSKTEKVADSGKTINTRDHDLLEHTLEQKAIEKPAKPVVQVANKAAVVVLRKFKNHPQANLAAGLHYGVLLALNGVSKVIALEKRDYLKKKPLFARSRLLLENADFVVSGSIRKQGLEYSIQIVIRDNYEDESYNLDEIKINQLESFSLIEKVTSAILEKIEKEKASYMAKTLATSIDKALLKQIGKEKPGAKDYFQALHMAKNNRKKAQRILDKKQFSSSALAKSLALYLGQKENPRYSTFARAAKRVKGDALQARFYSAVAFLLSQQGRNSDAQQLAAGSVSLLNETELAAKALYRASDVRYLLARARTRAVIDNSSAALKSLQKEGLNGSYIFAQILQARANAFTLASGGLPEAEKNYTEAYSLLSAYKNKTIHHAILFYNLSALNLQLKKYQLAQEQGAMAVATLRFTRNANSQLHFQAMVNLGLADYYLARYKEASQSFKSVATICDSLLIRRSLSCAKAYHYYGLSLVKLKQSAKANKWFRAANRMYRQSRQNSLANAARKKREVLRVEPAYDPFDTKLHNYLGFSYEEDDLLESYSAPRYRTNPAAFARTYGNRLDDTNVLIKDLLGTKVKSQALNRLRERVVTKSTNKKGRGILFVDIGPAVANVIEPAVTSVNVAHDFSHMQVVALDLPSEIRRYHKKVLKSAKKRLKSYKNLHLFSGDGLESLKDQFKQSKKWVFKDRAAPNLKTTDLVLIRTANAIDIYVKYKYVRPAIAKMAKDFKSKPVLLFFNRSILFKPRGKSFFKIIGHLSVRGFHHNKRSLDRKGQRPYTLLPSQLLIEK